MAINRTKALNSLADRLEDWTSQNNFENDPYLRQLINALRNRKNLHIFAELDPITYLPNLDYAGNFRKLRFFRLITVIRNVLVFAPVALTWAAVSASTQAFAEYTRENSLSVTNYLDFWQNGYGYLESHWKISSVATLDFLMILAVIVLTIYISIENQRIQEKRKFKEINFENERANLALEIAITLHDRKKISSVTMNSALAGSISRIVNASQSLEIAAKSLEKQHRAKN